MKTLLLLTTLSLASCGVEQSNTAECEANPESYYCYKPKTLSQTDLNKCIDEVMSDEESNIEYPEAFSICEQEQEEL